MTILNYKETHFNLIINENNMLATKGSISFQQKVKDSKTKQSPIEENTKNVSKLEEYDLVKSLKQRISALESNLEITLTENQILKEKLLMKPMTTEKAEFSNEENQYVCKECGSNENNEEQLNKHIYTTHFFFTHTCHKCGKCFSKQESLRNHKLNHPNRTKFVCDLCDLDFKTKNELMTHVKRDHVKKKLSDDNLTEYK